MQNSLFIYENPGDVLVRIAVVAVIVFVSSAMACAQESGRIKGMVIDAETLKPLPYAHLLSKRGGAVTNDDGFFDLMITIPDTIYASYIGYKINSYTVNIPHNDTIIIALSPSSTMLSEIVIESLPTEERFKQKIVEMVVEPSREEQNMEKNMAHTRTLYRMGYRPPMNNLENHFNYLKGPQDVTFFSSSPSKGIIKAIKSLKDKVKTESPGVKTNRNYRLPSPVPVSRKRIAIDSLAMDTLAIDNGVKRD